MKNKNQEKFNKLKEKFDDIGISIEGIPEDTSEEDEKVLEAAPEDSVILSGNFDGRVFFKLLVYYQDSENVMKDTGMAKVLSERKNYEGMILRYRLIGRRYYSDNYFIEDGGELDKFVQDLKQRK